MILNQKMNLPFSFLRFAYLLLCDLVDILPEGHPERSDGGTGHRDQEQVRYEE